MAIGTKNTKNLTSPWTAWFLYGPTGSGKTTAAATFPRPLFLVPQTERSVTTLMGQDFDYIELLGWKQPFNQKTGQGGLQPVLDALVLDYKKDPAKFPWDTLVIESMTHLCDMLVHDIENDPRVKGMQVWGELGTILRNLHNTLRSLDVHVVYTALSTVEGGDEAGAAVGGPMMSGKSAYKLPSSCDVIAYLEPGTGKQPQYRAHFARFKNFEARTRFDGMPKMVQPFNFSELEQFCTLPSAK